MGGEIHVWSGEEDWTDEWCYDWESDWMDDWQDPWYWHSSEECARDWYDYEGTYLVCGVVGSSPNLNQQRNDKVKLIDSGSQSTACSMDFAKGYATDDEDRLAMERHEGNGRKAQSTRT